MSMQTSGSLREMKANILSWPHKLVSSCIYRFTHISLRRFPEATGFFPHFSLWYELSLRLFQTHSSWWGCRLSLAAFVNIDKNIAPCILGHLIAKLWKIKRNRIQVIMQLAVMVLFLSTQAKWRSPNFSRNWMSCLKHEQKSLRYLLY